MSKGEGKVIGPGLNEGPRKHASENDEDEQARDPAVNAEGPFLEGPGGLQKGSCLSTDHGVALFGQVVIQEEGPNRRDQKNDTDSGPEIKPLHPNDLLVDLGG